MATINLGTATNYTLTLSTENGGFAVPGCVSPSGVCSFTVSNYSYFGIPFTATAPDHCDNFFTLTSGCFCDSTSAAAYPCATGCGNLCSLAFGYFFYGLGGSYSASSNITDNFRSDLEIWDYGAGSNTTILT